MKRILECWKIGIVGVVACALTADAATMCWPCNSTPGRTPFVFSQHIRSLARAGRDGGLLHTPGLPRLFKRHAYSVIRLRPDRSRGRLGSGAHAGPL